MILQPVNTLQLKAFYYFLVLILVFSSRAVLGQQVDSIFFHLYTDSLKKGVHNYINVDGKLSNGQWQPLTAKELHFTASAGRFEGNNLIIDTSFKGEKIDVKATLKANAQLWKEITIYIKTEDTTERLKTMEEVLPGSSSPGRKSKRNRRNP
ncbi:hypothetical protein [Paraflavitalea speifideaquila]|uniref:hypothetical protein n=1 Tax=Paraflavitalea speifideaquila TaxID=3076558 RepID=UPI0028E58E90|nr:hypothetical protein [Paraflavitalea speifideiaquila]